MLTLGSGSSLTATTTSALMSLTGSTTTATNLLQALQITKSQIKRVDIMRDGYFAQFNEHRLVEPTQKGNRLIRHVAVQGGEQG